MTRAIIIVQDKETSTKPLLYLYCHSDGYITRDDGKIKGIGAEIKTYFQDFEIISGIIKTGNIDKTKHLNTANGMNCFAAQLVAKLKTGIGQFYIADDSYISDCDYIYTLYELNHKLGIKIEKSNSIYFNDYLKNMPDVEL